MPRERWAAFDASECCQRGLLNALEHTADSTTKLGTCLRVVHQVLRVAPVLVGERKWTLLACQGLCNLADKGHECWGWSAAPLWVFKFLSGFRCGSWFVGPKDRDRAQLSSSVFVFSKRSSVLKKKTKVRKNLLLALGRTCQSKTGNNMNCRVSECKWCTIRCHINSLKGFSFLQ